MLKYQYFFKQDRCAAKEASDGNCICWHDEGTGPYASTKHDDPVQILFWRLAVRVTHFEPQTDLGKALKAHRDAAIAKGMPLLSEEEIVKEDK